jgi:hypothetical protein
VKKKVIGAWRKRKLTGEIMKIELISVWGVLYGGLPAAALMRGFHNKGLKVRLVQPDALEKCRVTALAGKETSIMVRKCATVKGPATAVCWLMGGIDNRAKLDGPEFANDVKVFDGRATFYGATVTFTGRCNGWFRDITEACFFYVPEQIDEDDKLVEQSFACRVESAPV